MCCPERFTAGVAPLKTHWHKPAQALRSGSVSICIREDATGIEKGFGHMGREDRPPLRIWRQPSNAKSLIMLNE